VKLFEQRMSVGGLEVRDDSAGPIFEGYASVFNSPYSMGWYTETVNPGAFKRSLAVKPDVRFLIDHDPQTVIARTTNGTLELNEDSKGLFVRAQLDPTDLDVQRLVPKVRNGNKSQMSFGFRTIEDEWSKDMSKRSMLHLDIHDGDVSSVTYPASGITTGTIRIAGGAAGDAVASALRALETRDASAEDIASVLTRALAYFTAIDLIVDSAQDEVAEALGIPNPDCDDDEASESEDMAMARNAIADLERRMRLLQLAG
jgi:HK97 family phage prohead protease